MRKRSGCASTSVEDRISAPAEGAVDEVRRCVEGLATPDALASIRRDPYWPKWNSPWWQMTLLWEMGEGARIPQSIAEAMTTALDEHYLHFFPLRPEDAPGADLWRHGLCHCMVGTICQVLSAAGIDVHARLPWIREWFPRYQLADGGWNCDETAYLRPTPRSSFLSTLPVLEALLILPDRTNDEDRMLDRGARYLVSRQLHRSISKDGVADPSWLALTFPRFYFYDVLRGLAFVRRWAALRGASLPEDATRGAIEAVRAHVRQGKVVVGQRAWTDAREEPGRERGGASTFELLDRVSVIGEPNPWLTRQWAQVDSRFAAATEISGGSGDPGLS